MTSRRVGGMACAMAIAAVIGPPAGCADAAGANAGSCMSLMMPAVQGVPGSAAEAAGGVRDLLAKYLASPSLKIVSLESLLPSQAGAEARAKGCEPILVVTLTRKAGGGRFTRALGQAAGTSSYYLPGGATAGSAAARVAAQTGLQTASSLAASTKSKDEMSLEYRLQSSSGDVRFGPHTESRKASADGEDLLTPIVMHVAETLVTRKTER